LNKLYIEFSSVFFLNFFNDIVILMLWVS